MVNSRLVTLLVVLVGFCSLGQGYKQELWLYVGDTTNALYFDANVPDLSIYGAALSAVGRYCSVGFWNTYEGSSYTISRRGLGSVTSEELHCTDVASEFIEVGSLRHFGANDTAIDSLSLFADGDFRGQEIVVTGRALTNIATPIKTLVGTGTGDWTLYEGKNLDGKSACFQVPGEGYNYNWSYDVRVYNITTVGSVLKGCDEQEIALYKGEMKLTNA